MLALQKGRYFLEKSVHLSHYWQLSFLTKPVAESPELKEPFLPLQPWRQQRKLRTVVSTPRPAEGRSAEVCGGRRLPKAFQGLEFSLGLEMHLGQRAWAFFPLVVFGYAELKS